MLLVLPERTRCTQHLRLFLLRIISYKIGQGIKNYFTFQSSSISLRLTLSFVKAKEQWQAFS